MLTCDDYLSPATLAEAFDAMEAHPGRYRLVAGATDILPWAREGRAGDVHIPVLIDVAGIPELNGRRIDKGWVQLGAATRFQRFLDDATLRTTLPVMPFCAVWFADDQIRESATIGGNLVNASPAADGTPALLALDAQVMIARREDRQIISRLLPLEAFVMGPGKTALAENEILTLVQAPAHEGYGAAFEKVGHRRSLVISTACVAALVKIDKRGRRFLDVRLAVAGVGPVPQRIAEIEQALAGQSIDARRILDVSHEACDLVASRTRKEYRREVVQGFVVRALLNATRRAGADPSLLPAEIEAAYV